MLQWASGKGSDDTAIERANRQFGVEVTQRVFVLYRLVIVQILCCKGHSQASEIYKATLKVGFF